MTIDRAIAIATIGFVAVVAAVLVAKSMPEPTVTVCVLLLSDEDLARLAKGGTFVRVDGTRIHVGAAR